MITVFGHQADHNSIMPIWSSSRLQDLEGESFGWLLLRSDGKDGSLTSLNTAKSLRVIR